ncbi:hypothetical protein IAR55_002944 [Kwoniella newhampshirensis]|uniref:RNase III domain-containing protein n=1 Tax=Kwoniella newhampshirensis TaxID=1651941 RepID=A0AAW0Z1G7_9TREE
MPSPYSRKDAKTYPTLMPRLPSTYLNSLPPVPSITDPKLATMVFTHTSAIMKPKSYNTSMVLLDGEAGMDYEKLEHVGDAILESVAVTMAHELYPNVRQGGASAIRDRLVCNATLAQISAAYGLHKRLRIQESMRHVIRGNEKVRASLFEAYIAGVYYSLLGPEVFRTQGSQKTLEEAGSATSDSSSYTHKAAVPSDSDESGPQQEIQDTDRKEENGANNELETDESQKQTSQDSIPSESPTNQAPIIETPSDTKHQSSSSEDVTLAKPEPSGTDSSGKSDSSSTSDDSNTTKPSRTRGEAFDCLFSWLSQVFEPITHFIVEGLKAEELRLESQARYAQLDIPIEWVEEDRKAVGGKATLHQSFDIAPVGLPSYTYEEVVVGSIRGAWKVNCTAKDLSGRTWQADATRMTKQAAGNVAAWKICRQMGLIDDE